MNNKVKKEILEKTAFTSIATMILTVIVALFSFIYSVSEMIWPSSDYGWLKILTIPVSICGIIAIISGVISLFIIKKSTSTKKGELIHYKRISIAGIIVGSVIPRFAICIGIFLLIWLSF